MFEYYQKTNLENWLENLYIEHNILSISDLTIYNVADKLNVNVIFMENAKEVAIWDDKAAAIFLNPEKLEEEVRAIFFHELCHPLRHYGDQVNSVRTFMTLQERQANQFMLYASMPFYMIKKLDMSTYNYQWASFLSYKFNVPINIAQKRAEQILQRIQQASIDQVIREQRSTYKPSNDPSEWSTETNMIMNKLYRQIGCKQT
ncbi:hypothetical protein Pryu01_03097 [Paraliobacillus ryukyuensis]|uniref:Uncharacterized protein DUF955 n=1 Tax=Paraliobacillus ryukyuensis TaxID=200904 RepID=A0A366DML6_9BACI|nr:ImmA/IrrE family metallo-endopeptidase [Paraliobacillus ryukyuensis]RBO91286.1 uncharacterized protein DUF955 [Paraliobacillus ryukyuensis]